LQFGKHCKKCFSKKAGIIFFSILRIYEDAYLFFDLSSIYLTCASLFKPNDNAICNKNRPILNPCELITEYVLKNCWKTTRKMNYRCYYFTILVKKFNFTVVYLWTYKGGSCETRYSWFCFIFPCSGKLDFWSNQYRLADYCNKICLFIWPLIERGLNRFND